MAEVLIGVVLLMIGGAAGWVLRGMRAAMQKGVHAEMEQAEAQQLRAERQAFEALLGYNAETAYGLNGREE